MSATKHFKVGAKVNVKRRNGVISAGTVHTDELPAAKGSFVGVNIGDKKNPQIMKVRPSQLSAA